MAQTFRIATFNVENLFARATALSMQDNAEITVVLNAVAKLQKEIAKKTYDAAAILALWGQVKKYAEVNETRGHLFNRAKTAVVAAGRDDWDGFIELKTAKIADAARRNTGRVIAAMAPDVCCLVEVESRPTLRRFDSEIAAALDDYSRFPHLMLIDGNDERGIDVGLVSRFPIGAMYSHVDDTDTDGVIFSRDCAEFEVVLPGGRTLTVLANHFKSKGYGSAAASNAKRLRQANRVRKILEERYDLDNDWVVVAGDFNDTPASAPLHPLTSYRKLHDVLELQFPDPADRWTYHYKKNEQIDFLLVSTALRQHFVQAGVERRGIFGVEGYTGGAVQPFPTVKRYADSASDHAGVWAEFEVG